MASTYLPDGSRGLRVKASGLARHEDRYFRADMRRSYYAYWVPFGFRERPFPNRSAPTARILTYVVNPAFERVELHNGIPGRATVQAVVNSLPSEPTVAINAGFLSGSDNSVGWAYSREHGGLYENHVLMDTGNLDLVAQCDYDNFHTLIYYEIYGGGFGSQIIRTASITGGGDPDRARDEFLDIVQNPNRRAVFAISGKGIGEGIRHTRSIQRSMIGVRADGVIILLATDAGRTHPTGQVSEGGLTVREGEEILRNMGAINVLNLDGGGSAQFWHDGRTRTYPGDLWEGRGVFRTIGSVFLVNDR